ncbi:unnamed protein product [Effrenium voratum]|uniref:Uncharacterized protein n=1 Tax=Effrenium voratum TaxID=2562239 RepID=A0AA36HTJ6_9DINO|nr:unnamed protein product [Effrenium voratum]
MLRDGRLSTNAPTLYPNNEELNMNGICFRTYDLGGHETARRIWKETTSPRWTASFSWWTRRIAPVSPRHPRSLAGSWRTPPWLRCHWQS